MNWYIDNRQIENGEFGGGLSDDGDLTNCWPATALMGATPDKIRRSLLREMDAFYDAGHVHATGLSTIQTDELHSYEEGIQVLGQSLLLDYGSPKQLERAMETAAAHRADHRRQRRRPSPHPVVVLQRHDDRDRGRLGLVEADRRISSCTRRSRSSTSTARRA